MLRTLFRILIGVTLGVMLAGRFTRGRLTFAVFPPFYYWFLASVFLFGAFGLFSAYRAWREPHNRRARLTDVLLAAAWIPYWFSNLR